VAKPHFRAIPGFRDYYADDAGSIWSLRPSRWGYVAWKKRKHGKGRDGYFDVVLYRSDGKKVNKSVHSLVALAFFGQRPYGLIVTHLNGIKTDNRVINLAYRSYQDNSDDKVYHGTMVQGEMHYKSKLTDAQIIDAINRFKSGEYLTVIARDIGVATSTLASIKAGRTRKYLQPFN
jgi:hypothetical protein